VAQFFSRPHLIVKPQVPQLWGSSLLAHGGNEALTRQVSSIAETEMEKNHKAAQKVE